MSVSLTNFRAKLNNILGDVVSGTTSANGNTEKTTLQDTELAKYSDHFFAEHIAFLPGVPEARAVEDSWQPEGIVQVYKPFTSQVAISTPYEFHKYHPDDKKAAINNALLSAYPYFYKRIEDVTLTGKGAADTEYAVPAAFADGFPDQVWLKKITGSEISFEEFFNVDFKTIAGSKKFYANISTDYTILLIGKTWLTSLTTEASATELTDEQAAIVCLKAAANLWRQKTTVVDAEDSGRFDTLADQKDLEFERLVRLRAMPEISHFSMDWSTLE